MTAPSRDEAAAAVIVNFRSAQYTLDCALALSRDGVAEIVVVDNASDDGCHALLEAHAPHVRFVQAGANLGYGRAANIGVAATTAPFVIITNPDITPQPGVVGALAAALRCGEAIGAAGPRIDRPDGTRYPSARTFPSLADAAGHAFVGLVSTENRFSRRYLRTDAEEPGPVDWVSGAFLMVRRAAFDAIGGFDPAFFMFLEDVDLCWRLHRAGWGVMYAPDGQVTHIEGVSRSSVPYRMIVAHHRSLLRYAARTADGRQRMALPAVTVGLLARTLLLSGRQVWQDGRVRASRRTASASRGERGADGSTASEVH